MAGNKSNKGRKIDRNRPACQAYRNGHTRERNKLRRILRHLRRQGYAVALAPRDVQSAIERYSAVVGKDIARRILVGGSTS